MAQKTGKVIVPTEPASRAMTITGFTFKSYDKKAGVLQFEIKNQDGSPTDLIDATVRLFMYIYQGEEKKEFPIFDNQIITESYMQGVVKYPIPDMLLSYEGKVDVNVYIDFPDGSHTDNLAFTFNIEKSVIDDNVQLNGEYYFKDFQQLLDGVKQEATDAVNAALTNIDTVSQNVTSAQNNLKAVEDKMNQTNQQIGDLGKLKKMYSNSIDFGDYDYSGNPNVMTKPYIAENITGGTTGLVVTSIDDGARIEKTRVDVPGGFELPLGNLLNNTDYIISYDVLVENGYTGDLKTCNIALEGQFDGKRNYIAVFYMNSVTSTDVWQKVYVKFNSGANMEKLSGFMFRVFLSQSVQVALKIKNVKIERGSTATPYQPNLLDAPYYLSKVALGENIITSKSYDNSNYLIGSFDINKTINNGDKLTFTIQGTKPANKQFGMYIQTTTGAATEFQGHLTPVEGLTDVWSWSSGAKISKPIGSGAKVVIYQLPPESQVPNGKCTISWAKLEKGDTRTPNISQFKYFGEGLKDSNNPNDYSWDITPEYAEKGLNDSVSLTEPQSVDGTKNFLETPLVNGKNVLVEEKPLPYEAWHSTGTEQTGISNKARLIIGPVATTIGAKLNRSMKENPLTWNSGNWQATANRDCTLLVEGLVRYQFGGSTAGQYGYITFYKDDAQTSSIGFAGGVGINGTALQWKHGLHFSRIFALKKGEYFNITFETQDGKKLDFSQINTLHIMEIES